MISKEYFSKQITNLISQCPARRYWSVRALVLYPTGHHVSVRRGAECPLSIATAVQYLRGEDAKSVAVLAAAALVNVTSPAAIGPMSCAHIASGRVDADVGRSNTEQRRAE